MTADNGETVKPPAEAVKPLRTVTQTGRNPRSLTTLTPGSEAKGSAVGQVLEQNGKEKEISDYLKEIMRVARERFFDTDQAVTLGKEGYSYIPGFASVVGITNPRGNMEVVVTYLNGLTSSMDIFSEDIEGEEIHVSYRQKVTSRKFAKLLKRSDEYTYGAMVFPSEGRGRHWIKKPYSIKSTMRQYDVERWEEGDTATSAGMGAYPGQTDFEPTKADYETILDTVTRGNKDVDLTRRSVKKLMETNNKMDGHLVEKHWNDAVDNLENRTQEIIRGEQLAVKSAAYSKTLIDKDKPVEEDQPGEQSFEIAEQRLRDLAFDFPGQDGEIIHSVADSLAAVSKTLDMVHTLLASDDPTTKAQLKSLTTDHSLPALSPREMAALLKHLSEHPKFADFREGSGFSRDAEFGTPLSAKYGPERSESGSLVLLEASQKAKMEILRAMGFLQPGESLAARLDRVKGEPEYAKDGSIHFFRYDRTTGEAIGWNPYRASGKYSSVSVTSPLFGSEVTAQIGVELQIAKDRERDRLEPTGEGIDDIMLRIESGESMIRLSKDRSKLRINGQKEG